jgi:hypothetical protein
MQIHAGAVPQEGDHGELLGQIRDPCSLCNMTVDAYATGGDPDSLGDHKFRFDGNICQPGLLCTVSFYSSLTAKCCIAFF